MENYFVFRDTRLTFGLMIWLQKETQIDLNPMLPIIMKPLHWFLLQFIAWFKYDEDNNKCVKNIPLALLAKTSRY